MRTNKISLNLFQSCLEDRGFEVKFFYDRVKLYVDSSNRKAKIEKICPNKEQHKIIPRTLLHYDTMNLMIDAHQPDKLYFRRLNNALRGDYLVNYVEFAMDILCKNKKQVTKLRKLLNGLLIFERKRSDIRFYHKKVKNIHYFGNRFEHSDISVIYSDLPSKLDENRNCVHIEMRLYGSTTIKGFGIYTIQDLIEFQHKNIWDKYLDLRDVNYNKLGRLSAKAKGSLVDSSHWRHGQKMFNKYCSVQELLMLETHCAEAFVPIKNRRMFESRLNNALK
jgi:hypothetical protein